MTRPRILPGDFVTVDVDYCHGWFASSSDYGGVGTVISMEPEDEMGDTWCWVLWTRNPDSKCRDLAKRFSRLRRDWLLRWPPRRAWDWDSSP